ncbi:hypothetical protein ACNKHT_17865 [Shigella flexneri]
MLKAKGMNTAVGDEGGDALNLGLHNAEVWLLSLKLLKLLVMNWAKTSLSATYCAASEFYKNGKIRSGWPRQQSFPPLKNSLTS